jgi:hypothetical protein
VVVSIRQSIAIVKVLETVASHLKIVLLYM